MTAYRRDTSNGESKGDREHSGYTLDAVLIDQLLGLPPADVPALTRSKSINSMRERGIDADHGAFRPNLFYGGCPARLGIGSQGQILKRSIIDFGERPLSRGQRKATGRKNWRRTLAAPSGLYRAAAQHNALY